MKNEAIFQPKAQFILPRRPQNADHQMVFHACTRAGAFIIPRNTQVKLLGIPTPLVEMQKKLKYIQLGAGCELRAARKYEPSLTG